MYVSAVILALSMMTRLATDVTATKKSRVCRTKNWPACALQETEIMTSNFSVFPTSLSTADEAEIQFSLRVYHNECPTVQTRGVQWYKIEAFAAGTNTSIGQFVELLHSRRLETYTCHDDSVVVFDTCEPHPLDLPRQYKWKIPRANFTMDDEVCFRMTILDTDGQCKYTEHCIVLLSVRNELGSSSADRESGMAPPSPGSGAFGDIDSSNLTKKCHRRWDCSNAKMRLFCGTDGNTYTSRCEIRLKECLTDTDISIDYAGECVDQPEPVCHTQAEVFKQLFEGMPEHLYWLPTCDCDGLFKPIQCDRDRMNPGHLECWCSYSNSISEVVGTRQKIIDICTDPTTFEFSCSTT